MHPVGSDADRSLRLRMSLFADVDDMVAIRCLFPDQIMRLGHVRAGRVHDRQPFLPRLFPHFRRDAVSRKNDGSFVYLIQQGEPVFPVKRFHTHFLKRFHNMRVVDDHSQNVNGTRQIKVLGSFEREHHGIDDTVAIAAGGNFNDFHVYPSLPNKHTALIIPYLSAARFNSYTFKLL